MPTNPPSSESPEPSPEPRRRTPRPRWQLGERIARFPILQAMSQRVLLCDGAMGTMLQRAHLVPEDFLGLDGCNEILCASRPDVVASVHRAYFEAGADLVETNTFGSTPLVLAEYGLADRAYELSKKAAELARKEADALSTPSWPRFVSGAVGPTTKLVSLQHVSYDDLFASFVTQIRGLIDGGSDVIQIETAQDLLGVKCAVLAARRAMELSGRELPIITQVTIETTGTMLVGTEIAAALPALEALDVDVIGLNCATGPDLMHEHVRYLGESSARFVSGQEPTAVTHAQIRREQGVDVFSQLTAEFPGFAYRGVVSMRMHNRQFISFHGSLGHLTLTAPFNAGVYDQAELVLETAAGRSSERWPAVNQYVLQVQAFGRSVREGLPYACPLEFSRGTQRMIDMTLAAAEG